METHNYVKPSTHQKLALAPLRIVRATSGYATALACGDELILSLSPGAPRNEANIEAVVSLWNEWRELIQAEFTAGAYEHCAQIATEWGLGREEDSISVADFAEKYGTENLIQAIKNVAEKAGL